MGRLLEGLLAEPGVIEAVAAGAMTARPHRGASVKRRRRARATEIVIPDRCLLLLSGIPATGKSRLGRYLARAHGFAHYDLECYPGGRRAGY